MRKFLFVLAASLTLAMPLQAETFKEAFPALTAQLVPEIQERTSQMQLLHGTIALQGGMAQVVVPPGYYFLGPADARHVIETLWGNPADPSILGLLVPAAMSTLGDKDWAVTVQYDPMGYVSDADATGYDYASLLKTMQDDAQAGNADRKAHGFDEITLLGWAEPPSYDQASRKLYWAKRLQFSNAPGETLNYNIRALGRKGVLVVNFIGGMDQLAEIKAAAPVVGGAVSFTQGNTYADYLPDVDTVAAVGIGGLIAGKVLSSTGVLAVALILLKKFGIFLVVGLAWVWRKVKSGFGVKSRGVKPDDSPAEVAVDDGEESDGPVRPA